LLASVVLAHLFGSGTACGTARTGRSPAEVAVPDVPGADAAEFALTGSDGLVMHAQLFLPGGDGPFAVALVLPGGRGAAEVGKAWRHHTSFAADLGQQGLAAMVLDYHGSDRLLQDPRTIADIGVAVDALRKNPKIRPDRLFLVGFSMGGANALRVAGSRSDIAGVVSFFAPAELGRGDASSAAGARQPVDYVRTVSCPALILQGDRDEITPVEQAHILSRAFAQHGGSARLITYPGAGHGFTYLGAPRAKCCNYDAEVTASAVKAVAEFMRNEPINP
jgi:dienelactone hydrolase